MLLPIDPSDLDRFRDIPFRRVLLMNLFSSIRSGIAVTQETPRRVLVESPLETGLRPVVFLRMQSLHRFTSRIDWNVVRSDLVQEPQQASDAKTLSEEEILQEDDYLLTMRGKPHGMGLAQMYETMPVDLRALGLRLAAGNNFIRLRPNPEADCEPSFLHFLLDMLAMELRIDYQRLGKSGSSPDIPEDADDASEGQTNDTEARLKGSFIKVSDLKAMTLNIPKRREDRDWLQQEYLDLTKAQREAWRNLHAYRNGFRKYVIPRKQN
ncbi:MAG: hypothetical protein EBZ67_00950 [Chitinophagia bacterium]|nr:hypothetical protein [Chitinophagia bacterium]